MLGSFDPTAFRRRASSEVAARVTFPTGAQPGFDAERARADALIASGLPRRPDPGTHPELYDLWRLLVLPRPAETFQPQLEVEASARGVASDNSGLVGPGSGHWGSSENWSGAIIHARDGDRFERVAAMWEIPTPALPQGDSFNSPPVNDAWRASFWIGLDGHRLASRSLPQLGTTIAIEAGQGPPRIVAYAWAQWWVRSRRFGEVKIRNFPVAPGQRVVAWLEVVSRTEVDFHFRNLANPDSAPTTMRWAAGLVDDDPAKGDRSMAPVEGSAACFVAERPLSMPPPLSKVADVLYPLPDFGVLTMERCGAEMRNPDDPTDPAAPRNLMGARRLRMVEVAGAGTRMVAAPTQPGDVRSLAVGYVPRPA